MIGGLKCTHEELHPAKSFWPRTMSRRSCLSSSRTLESSRRCPRGSRIILKAPMHAETRGDADTATSDGFQPFSIFASTCIVKLRKTRTRHSQRCIAGGSVWWPLQVPALLPGEDTRT